MFIPFSSVSPILLTDLPMLVGIRRSPFKTAQLLGLCDVHEKLHQDRSSVHQCSLKIQNFTIPPLPLLLLRKTFHPLHQHPPIPASVEDRRLPRRRNLIPKSPQIMMRLFLLRWLYHRPHSHQSWIQSFRQPFDYAPFSRRIGPLENQDQTLRAVLQQPLRMQQLELKPPQLLPIFRLLLNLFVQIQMV